MLCVKGFSFLFFRVWDVKSCQKPFLIHVSLGYVSESLWFSCFFYLFSVVVSVVVGGCVGVVVGGLLCVSNNVVC